MINVRASFAEWICKTVWKTRNVEVLVKERNNNCKLFFIFVIYITKFLLKIKIFKFPFKKALSLQLHLLFKLDFTVD